MEINRNNLLEIMKFFNISAKKELGQNFLINPSVCLDISNLIEENKKTLEIGPGFGSLTHFLLQKTTDLTVCDLDTRMTEFLKVQYKDSNINVINKDILKLDVSDYEVIIGNLPYYITTDIITYLLKNAKKCKQMVFMIQKEAYPRFRATIKEDEYCPISILISMLGNIKKAFNVGMNSFYPNPHVDSLVFTIDILNRDEEIFKVYSLAKAMFLNRRKTILNNLSNYLKDKEKTKDILSKANIEENRRPEDISIEEYKLLNKLLNS